MLEKDIERKLVLAVGKKGGLCLKWVCPGHVGVPDRIILMPGGRVAFAELKTATGRPSKLQQLMIDKLVGLGFDARILYGLDEVIRYADAL